MLSGELKIPTAAQARYATNDTQGKFYTTLPNGQGVTGDDGVSMTPQHTINEGADFWCFDEGYNNWHYGIGDDGKGAGLDDGAHDYVLATDFKRNVASYSLRNVNYIVGRVSDYTVCLSVRPLEPPLGVFLLPCVSLSPTASVSLNASIVPCVNYKGAAEYQGL